MNNITKFHILNGILILFAFTIIIPTLYYMIWRNGYVHLFDLVHDKYNLDKPKRISNFFKTLY